MEGKDPSSFRDPSGHIFHENGIVYRQINPSYFEQFGHLVSSGLYNALVNKKMLVPHELVEENDERKVIRPAQLSFISYPYEWSFSQLRDAALLTLRIHVLALEYGMVLKDASAFNIQFERGHPVFIDTLSFNIYKKDDPWLAYGQFCRHFLAPLLLMKYRAPNLNRLQILYIDGLPLEIASDLLPFKTHFSPFVKTNIHLHASLLRKHQRNSKADNKIASKPKLSLRTQNNIVQSMINYVDQLSTDSSTEWGNYYDIINYDSEAFKFKEKTIKAWVKKYALTRIWDIGGNNGHFSRLILDPCEVILCSDIDPVAVDQNYRITKSQNVQKIIPLMVDYTNPSPGIGFDNKERADFLTRVKDLEIDCILALALIHHLSISNNCTFEMLAESFSRAAEKLVIEFVHPDDSWANSLLDNKRDARALFSFYNQANFETVFSRYYEITEVSRVPTAKRTLYFMTAKFGAGDAVPE